MNIKYYIIINRKKYILRIADNISDYDYQKLPLLSPLHIP